MIDGPNGSRPLSETPPGTLATVAEARLEDTDRRMLEAMGLLPDRSLQVHQQGEPCIVEVGGTRLGLARALAERILVRTEIP